LLLLGFVFPLHLAPIHAQEDETVCAPTPADMLGPYYIEGAPETDVIYPDDAPGDWLLVRGRVTADDCETPLVGAVVEVWQADDNGEYDFSEDFIGRGQVITDENGYYEFITLVPGRYEPRPPHIHYRVSITDPVTETETALVTQLYFEGMSSEGYPEAQVAALEDFDLDAFLLELAESEGETEETESDDEDTVDRAEHYAGVVYVATFDVVLAVTP
jgi:protocatechuate 3,4-dioxygenase beta subunit